MLKPGISTRAPLDSQGSFLVKQVLNDFRKFSSKRSTIDKFSATG